jgi:hypothetical protein
MKFSTTSEQDDKIACFKKNHKCALPASHGAIGGAFTISFTSTTLGTVVTVECVCGAKEDVTNYKEW